MARGRNGVGKDGKELAGESMNRSCIPTACETVKKLLDISEQFERENFLLRDAQDRLTAENDRLTHELDTLGQASSARVIDHARLNDRHAKVMSLLSDLAEMLRRGKVVVAYNACVENLEEVE